MVRGLSLAINIICFDPHQGAFAAADHGVRGSDTVISLFSTGGKQKPVLLQAM
jgi:hypothetical protein